MTNTANNLLTLNVVDSPFDLEKFVDMELDSTIPRTPESAELFPKASANVSATTRRHTVGPGDVAHEHALANPTNVPINFKFGPENGPHLPINLPMLGNQPLHNFTIKNQHLLKPPTVMEASKLFYVIIKCFICTK